MAKAPLTFAFYIAAPIEKVWNGFVSKEANQTIFMGADFEVDLKPGGAMAWSGPVDHDCGSARRVAEFASVAEPPFAQPWRSGFWIKEPYRSVDDGV